MSTSQMISDDVSAILGVYPVMTLLIDVITEMKITEHYHHSLLPNDRLDELLCKLLFFYSKPTCVAKWYDRQPLVGGSDNCNTPPQLRRQKISDKNRLIGARLILWRQIK